jgi:hypothetical protein
MELPVYNSILKYKLQKASTYSSTNLKFRNEPRSAELGNKWVLEGPSATNLLYYFFYFAALYHFINKKIKILNVGNFAEVDDIFYVA